MQEPGGEQACSASSADSYNRRMLRHLNNVKRCIIASIELLVGINMDTVGYLPFISLIGRSYVKNENVLMVF